MSGSGYIDAVAMQERDLTGDGDFADSDEVAYYHSSTIHSVYALTNSSETVVERYKFDAYGKVTVLEPDWSADGDNASDVENPYLFQARRWDDESGLYYFRARMMDEYLGRFVQRDWCSANKDDQILEAYPFAGGKPVNRIDATGCMDWWPPSEWLPPWDDDEDVNECTRTMVTIAKDPTIECQELPDPIIPSRNMCCEWWANFLSEKKKYSYDDCPDDCRCVTNTDKIEKKTKETILMDWEAPEREGKGGGKGKGGVILHIPRRGRRHDECIMRAIKIIKRKTVLKMEGNCVPAK